MRGVYSYYVLDVQWHITSGRTLSKWICIDGWTLCTKFATRSLWYSLAVQAFTFGEQTPENYNADAFLGRERKKIGVGLEEINSNSR